MLVRHEGSDTPRKQLTGLPYLCHENDIALIGLGDEGCKIIRADERICQCHRTRSLLAAAQAFAIERFQPPADEHSGRLDQVAGDVDFHRLAIVSHREQKRSIETLYSVMESLPAPEVIE